MNLLLCSVQACIIFHVLSFSPLSFAIRSVIIKQNVCYSFRSAAAALVVHVIGVSIESLRVEGCFVALTDRVITVAAGDTVSPNIFGESIAELGTGGGSSCSCCGSRTVVFVVC